MDGAAAQAEAGRYIVTFEDGRAVEFRRPVRGCDLVAEPELNEGTLMAIKANGKVMNLNAEIRVHQARVMPVFLNSMEGWSVYRRSLVFVTAMAAFHEFGKQWLLTLEHYSGAGYMFAVNGGAVVSKEDLSRLKTRIGSIVKANIAITETVLAYQEALEYFERTNRPFSRRLIDSVNDDMVRCSVCDGFMALYFRSLAARTGVLEQFELQQAEAGFILLFPNTLADLAEWRPSALHPEDKIMNAIYREYNDWGRTLQVGCVGELNQIVADNRWKNFIALSEALHNRKIIQIAMDIAKRQPRPKLILISGPSASGKTTLASKLITQLCILGLKPVLMSVDNYFVPRNETPKDYKGRYDFECLEALRVGMLNDHLLELFKGGQIEMPIYDFRTGAPRPQGVPTQLGPNGVLLMEGIHCLNPTLTARVPDELKYKIFIAPLSQLNLDECNFTSNSIARLIRRIVRDYNHRGFSAKETLARWESVTAGENKHIFPYMHNADVVFNTALDYEFAVLKAFVTPLLHSVKPSDTDVYHVARNLMDLLEMFYTIPYDSVPPQSLLREFIGNSFYE
eukprot:TRINITY_DN7932_c0_g1_i1.p1 TRINITY_DN7932_c0_g1~~TRINITY_DN7932_c0_g1_i1.p1  ORF type:complete len:575 (-),score=153.62 TRINITY_DN7932_c0_g1_i1:53-1753(-)